VDKLHDCPSQGGVLIQDLSSPWWTSVSPSFVGHYTVAENGGIAGVWERAGEGSATLVDYSFSIFLLIIEIRERYILSIR
jgi:hypothetical protein